MLDKLEIVKENNEKLSVDIVSMFQTNIDGIDKKFCLITANEIDQNGLVKIHVAEILDDKLVKIDKDNEWVVVKNVMRTIISGSSSSGDKEFTYINIPGPFNANNDFSRIVAVKDEAKNQLINDYRNNRPEVREKEVNEEQPIENEITANIYPTDNAEAPIGAEVIPGIIENVPIPDVQVETQEEKEEVTPINSVNEDVKTTDFVAPTNEVDFSGNEKTPRDLLIEKIVGAVDEYIRSSQVDNHDNERIKELENELAVKNKMLESITSLINKA